jgi:hypothetical protein
VTVWGQVLVAFGPAVPVILLDGFDELLQATGVSQSDYLLKVARFQQCEADQGRPVIALVTSRIAVADRVRYPEGTLALRLEPFRDEQVETIRYLTAAMELTARDDLLLQLVLEGTLSALQAGQADDDQRQALTRIASDALAAARATSLPAALRMWITLHRRAAEYAPLFGEDPETFMAEAAGPQVSETHPDLLRHALAIMAAKYPEITL